MTKGLSLQARERIDALVSQNNRLTAALKHAEEFVAEQAERYASELSETLGERDRARATAVAFEQQLAQVEHEMRDLQARYERRDESEFSGESSAALDAVQDCVTTVETVTDVIGDDQCADLVGRTNADPS